MKAIFKRELKSYFTGFTGYIFAAFLLLFEGIFLVIINLLNRFATFEFSLENILVILLLIVPIISMRSIAEEKRSKTDQLLFSLPIKTYSIVLGKYFALLCVLLIPTLVIGLYPLILSIFGKVNLLSAYACLFAFYLLAAALIAVCMFMSSLTESQIVAAVLGFGSLMVFYLAKTLSSIIPQSATVSLITTLVIIAALALVVYNLTKNVQISAIAGGILAVITLLAFFIKRDIFVGLIPSLIGKLALFDSYAIFTYGVFDVSTVISYLSVAVLFVFLTAQSMEKKRWN